MTSPDFTALPDLASRALGGSVSAANDELFAQRENLIKAEAPFFDPSDFGHKGKVYDGWETRRRRDDGHDYAIVRLGAAGIIHGIIVDTAHFKGNYPPFISIEAASIEGYPSIEEVMKADVADHRREVPGRGATPRTPTPSPTGTGGHTCGCRSTPTAASPGCGCTVRSCPTLGSSTGRWTCWPRRTADASSAAPTRSTRRPRTSSFPGGPGTWGGLGELPASWRRQRLRGVLAGRGRRPRHVEIDTSYYVGNAPGWVRLSTADARTADIADESAWTELLSRTAVQPDTRHRFVLDATEAATHLRLDVYPDGGLSRLRLFGDLDATALSETRRTWWKPCPRAIKRSSPTRRRASRSTGALSTPT